MRLHRILGQLARDVYKRQGPSGCGKSTLLSLIGGVLVPASGSIDLLGHLDLARDLWLRPATDLSVGQQQRVAAARALIGHPELLTADEPTSALDAERQEAFLDLLLHEANAAGSTVLFVSHDRRRRC